MRNGIKRKITLLVLVISLTSLVLLFAFSLTSILVIRNRTNETSSELSQKVSQDSASALAWQSQLTLMLAAESLMMQTEDKMASFTLYSRQIADYITNIFENPTDYADRDYAESDSANKVVLQYFNSSNPDTVTNDAKKIANAAFIMENIVESNNFITALYFAGADGTFIVANTPIKNDETDVTNPENSSNMTKKSWYVAAKEAKKTIFDVIDDTVGRGKGISCATPVYDDKTLVGVVGVGGLLDDVANIINGIKLDFNGFAFVVDDKKQIVIGDRGGLNELVDQMQNEDTVMVLADYKGKEVFLAYYGLNSSNKPQDNAPELKWKIAAVYEYDAVLEKSYALLAKIDELSKASQKTIDQTIMGTIFTFFGIVILTGITIFAIGKSFATKLTNPILALNNGIDEINGKNIKYENHIRTGDEIESLGESFERMTIQISSYIDNLATVTAEKERIGAELSIATQIQASMLPCIFPPFPEKKEFDIFAAMHPAKEVGGDFYDFFLIDNDRLAVIAADVSGKGVPAALFMVIAKTLIKNHAQMGKTTSEIFTETNAQLCEGNEAGLFVTAWLGILEISSGKLSYSNAGHNPPLIKRKGGKYDYLRAKAGFVLAGMEGIRYGQFETSLNKGDELFLYTDGVTEATNVRNELLGEDRLLKCLNRSIGTSSKTIIDNVEIEIEKFVDGEQQFDDITMLCLQIRDGMSYIEKNASMDSMDALQEFAEKELDSGNVSQKIRFQIAIIIEEMFVNIVKYAYRGCGGLMKMGCNLVDDTFTLQFIDSGAMFDPLTVVADTSSELENRKIGGLGLHMVKKTVNKMEYSYINEQNIVTLTKKL